MLGFRVQGLGLRAVMGVTVDTIEALINYQSYSLAFLIIMYITKKGAQNLCSDFEGPLH